MASKTSPRLAILTYHGIVAEPGVFAPARWSRRHTIDAITFAQQLDYIVTSESKTMLPNLLDDTSAQGSLVITFDDAHSSDYTIAADALERRHLSAAFFVPWCYLDQPGYLEKTQVRALRSRSFEIGSHSLTHRRLTQLSEQEVWREVLQSKLQLEDLLGESVATFALPYGSYEDFILQAIWAAGYTRILTSDFGIATRLDHVMHRISVLRHIAFNHFRHIIDLNRSAIGCIRAIDLLERWVRKHRLQAGASAAQ